MTAAMENEAEEDVIFDAETDGEEGEDLDFNEFLANFADPQASE